MNKNVLKIFQFNTLQVLTFDQKIFYLHSYLFIHYSTKRLPKRTHRIFKYNSVCKYYGIFVGREKVGEKI